MHKVVIGLDLGGTKLSGGVFDSEGNLLRREVDLLDERKGDEVMKLIRDQVIRLTDHAKKESDEPGALGVSVPGIVYPGTGRVWVPNIHGWEDYPLLDGVREAMDGSEVQIVLDNDRACSLSGEVWKGNAGSCKDVIFLAVGTGIGAGIMCNGQIVQGSGGAAGAVGWMGLSRPFMHEYVECGCFEYHASGEGLARVAKAKIGKSTDGSSVVAASTKPITAHDVLKAHAAGDLLAREVVNDAITYWGMAVANFVSIFNPERIIFGGGVFGPALEYLDAIRDEAAKWAQPVSMKKVNLVGAALGQDAALFGAAYLAWQKIHEMKRT